MVPGGSVPRLAGRVEAGRLIGVLADEVIDRWVVATLGADPVALVFEAESLSRVRGMRLSDGRVIVVKIRPFESRLVGCAAVQARLADQAFPCPAPIAGPDEVAGWAVSAETYLPGGEQLAPSAGAGPFAALLAQLVSAASGAVEASTLNPPPPWCAWDHRGRELWPKVDDHGRDLNRVGGPGWVDDSAREVRGVLLSGDLGPSRVGHGDFESQNIRWAGSEPLAVHDWDSVIAQPEIAIAGLASAIWAARGEPGQAADVGQSEAFLDCYQDAARLQWSAAQLRLAWATGLWVRLFNAKKDAAIGGGAHLDHLVEELDERLHRVGLRR